MSVAVGAPISALENSLKTLNVNGYNYLQDRKFEKKQFDEEQKKKLVFDTPYEPSLDWWESNQAEYIKPADDPLPEGFPEEVKAASVWDGKVLINQPEKWLYRFTDADVELLNKSYDHFAALNLHNDEISRETFPFSPDSPLYKALAEASEDIKTGLGVRVLRGLPVDSWTRSKQLVIFAGISAYIGGKRVKQGKQNVVHLRDITNLEVDKRPAITVKGQTSGNQVFHNDGSTGIIGLITLDVAEKGGLSQLSSVGQTYNELAHTRRDILRELAKDNWINRIHPDGQAIFHSVNGEEVVSSYGRRPYFSFYEADADVPPLAKEKHLALDGLHFTAERFALDLDLQKGDLEYFNNLKVFHARTASEDSEEKHRHLVRIWLRYDKQPLPAHLRETFNKLNDGEAHEWPLEAWDSNDPYVNIKPVLEAKA